MHVGWMISTRKSQDTWSRTSRTRVIRRCLQQPAKQQWEEWSRFKAVIQNSSMFTFDVTSAYTHALEDELVFLEPPLKDIEEHGDCVWRSIKVI